MTALESVEAAVDQEDEHGAFIEGQSVTPPPSVLAEAINVVRLASRSARWVFGSLLVVHAVLLVLFVTPVDAPTVYPDEFSYIAIARDFAGGYNDAQFSQLVYQFGYGAMLAPLAWLFDTPYGFHNAAQFLNIALALAVGPMLFALIRRIFDLDAARSGAAAGLGILAPATMVQPALLWAESAFTAATVLAMLALVCFVDDSRPWRGVLLAGSLAWAYAVHPRGLVLSVAVLMVLAVLAYRRTVNVPTTLLTVGGLFALISTVREVQAGVAQRVFGTGGLPLDAESEWDLILNSGIPNADRWLRGLVGALWYQGIVTVGLVVVVAWWSMKLVARHWRSPDAESSLAMALGLAWGAALVVGALVFLGADRRIDHAVYGRYAGHLTPLLLAIGAALVMQSPSAQAQVLRVAVPLIAVGAFVTRLVHPWGFWAGGFAVPNASVFGAIGHLVGLAEPLRVGAVATVIVMGFLFVLHRRGPVALVVPAIFLVSSAAWTLVDSIDPRSEWSERSFTFMRQLPSNTDVGPLIIGDDVEVFITRYGMQYWRPDIEFVNESEATASSRFWIVSSDRRRPRAEARLVGSNDDFAVRFWVEPGAVADGLAFRERLFWPDIDLDVRVPRPAMDASLMTISDETVTVERGEVPSVRVLIRHEGESYPWPTASSMVGEATVRLGARWFFDGEEVTQSRAELQSPVFPGQTRAVELRLDPTGFDGEPLPAGTYEVRVDLLQELVAWFGDVGATEPIELTVVVS